MVGRLLKMGKRQHKRKKEYTKQHKKKRIRKIENKKNIYKKNTKNIIRVIKK